MTGETGNSSSDVIKINDPDPIRRKLRSTPSLPAPQKPVDAERKATPLLPDHETNIKASERFITALRNPKLYKRLPDDSQDVESDLGYIIHGLNAENDWFDSASVGNAAERRYQLPMAMYIEHDHANLLVRGPYQTVEGMRIEVYNPKLSGLQEIKVDIGIDKMPIGVTANFSAANEIRVREYDIIKVLDNPKLVKYKNLLKDMKAFNFQNQKDSKNCIPYCLFVDAMLHGLEPGNTAFKLNGIKRFEQDFGVRIMTREEITGEKILSRVKIRPDIKVE